LSFSKDKGRMLENLVFIELKRQQKEICYFKNRGGCDFVVAKNTEIESIIQVCYELNADNMDRAINGLKEAMLELGLIDGLILTLDQEGEIQDTSINMKLMPVWKWMN